MAQTRKPLLAKTVGGVIDNHLTRVGPIMHIENHIARKASVRVVIAPHVKHARRSELAAVSEILSRRVHWLSPGWRTADSLYTPPNVGCS